MFFLWHDNAGCLDKGIYMFEFAAIVAAIGLLLTGMAISNIYMMQKKIMSIALELMETAKNDIERLMKKQAEQDINPWER